MNKNNVERDERTTAVENAGYRLSYLIVTFGLLGLTAYRSLAMHQPSWDLLTLVILSGIVNATYQGSRRVINVGWIVRTLGTVFIALLLAVLLITIQKSH